MTFKPGDKVRPYIAEYFPNLEQAHSAYLAAPELFQYAQALDNYIDDLEPTPASKVNTVGEEEKDKWIKRIYEILPCTCVDTYKSRQMADPNCPQCNYAEYIDEGIVTPLLSTISNLRAELEQLKKVK